jgi:hypothetical protein
VSEILLLTFSALFLKHFAFDYPFQTQSEIANKGIYGNLKGMTHSLKHGLGSTLVLFLFTSAPMALLLGLLDFVTHYHIDWAKVRLTKGVLPNSKKWWTLFGLDQLAHALVYVAIVWLIKGENK